MLSLLMEHINFPFTKTDQMKDLLNSSADVFFFDIEETVLANNPFYTALQDKHYSYILYELCNGVNLQQIISLGKNFIRKLLDPELPGILKLLSKKKKRIFALTSGFWSFPKLTKLSHLNIHFEHIIFTKKQEKGPILIDFLERYGISGKCSFIDNHLEKLENVYEHYTKFYNKEIELYWFQRQSNTVVNRNNFMNYWQRVIQAYRYKQQK